MSEYAPGVEKGWCERRLWVFALVIVGILRLRSWDALIGVGHRFQRAMEIEVMVQKLGFDVPCVRSSAIPATSRHSITF
jgi:hypothetical protein